MSGLRSENYIPSTVGMIASDPFMSPTATPPNSPVTNFTTTSSPSTQPPIMWSVMLISSFSGGLSSVTLDPSMSLISVVTSNMRPSLSTVALSGAMTSSQPPPSSPTANPMSDSGSDYSPPYFYVLLHRSLNHNRGRCSYFHYTCDDITSFNPCNTSPITEYCSRSRRRINSIFPSCHLPNRH